MNMPISEDGTARSHAEIERLVLKAYLASTSDPAFRAFVRNQIPLGGDGARTGRIRRSPGLPPEIRRRA